MRLPAALCQALADHNQYGLGGDIWYGGGNIAAVWRNRWPDRLSMTIAVWGSRFRHLLWGYF